MFFYAESAEAAARAQASVPDHPASSIFAHPFESVAKAVEDGRWYFGEPLWVAVEKSGAVAASFFWVGSEADIQGIRPTHYKIYDGRVANKTRVQQVLDWLQLSEQDRPKLITMYFSDVDSAGHNHGPDSPQVNTAIAKHLMT